MLTLILSSYHHLIVTPIRELRLYVEGESDERIIRAWAYICGAKSVMEKICFKIMGGGSKESMRSKADEHFNALRQIIPGVSRLMIFDYDESEKGFHPQADNPTLSEWKRKNIENYLLVPDAWRRAAQGQLLCDGDILFEDPTIRKIDEFFTAQNLTLPPKSTWRSLNANIFKIVDGKRILFEDDDSLFHQLRKGSPSIELIREKVAMTMRPDEIHEDVHLFINKMLGWLQSG
ncbi:MAG: hypothetical protein HY911_05585 [Desulfobacterales bacterium]|nr:hypothetical protein [Desulfobacterales bacterium]